MCDQKYLFISELTNYISEAKSIRGGYKLTDVLNETNLKIEKVNTEIIKANMISTINNLIETFQSPDINSNEYIVEEIDISLNIGIDGSVSIVSFQSGLNLSSGITIKLKRNTD